MTRKTTITVTLMALGAPLLAGCGNLTVGGFGEATVVVSGDAPDPAPSSPLAVLLPAWADPALSDHDDAPEGELQLEFLLFLEGADGSEVSLSDDELEVQADLEGTLEVDAVDAVIVPAKRYTGLKIVFLEIKAEVSAGLVINGQPVLGEIRVELEDPSLTVSKPINLDIRDGDMVEMLVDMNAAAWLQAVDPNLLVVAQQIFENSISVVIR